jgi:NAD(P)H dehydrogenase (quinone)
MTVGITGATGQLGRRVIEALKGRLPATHIVVALVREPAKAAGLGVQVRERTTIVPGPSTAPFPGLTRCC